MKKNIQERNLTDLELKYKEEEMKKLKSQKQDFVKRYGKDAESIMYGISVNRAKEKAQNKTKNEIRETIKSILNKNQTNESPPPLEHEYIFHSELANNLKNDGADIDEIINTLINQGLDQFQAENIAKDILGLNESKQYNVSKYNNLIQEVLKRIKKHK